MAISIANVYAGRKGKNDMNHKLEKRQGLCYWQHQYDRYHFLQSKEMLTLP